MRALWLVLCACATTSSGRGPIVPFREGMTPPVLDTAVLAGVYGRAAVEAQVEGLLVLRCAVMADGTVRDCRQLKSLPVIGEEVVSRLEAARIQPATERGEPVSVDYVFNFAFKFHQR